MKPKDVIVKGTNPPWLVGKKLRVQSVSKKTGMLTVELLEQAASYRPGSIFNLMPHEVEKSK